MYILNIGEVWKRFDNDIVSKIDAWSILDPRRHLEDASRRFKTLLKYNYDLRLCEELIADQNSPSEGCVNNLRLILKGTSVLTTYVWKTMPGLQQHLRIKNVIDQIFYITSETNVQFQVRFKLEGTRTDLVALLRLVFPML